MRDSNISCVSLAMGPDFLFSFPASKGRCVEVVVLALSHSTFVGCLLWIEVVVILIVLPVWAPLGFSKAVVYGVGSTGFSAASIAPFPQPTSRKEDRIKGRRSTL